jgi:transposase
VRQARGTWKASQPGWPAGRLVFIDETGLNTKMTRGYGRAPLSSRCICKVPHGHWHTNTFIAALRVDGILAPWLLDGPMNTEAFEVYIQEVLAPELREGDKVICDNLSCHHAPGVRGALGAVGAELMFLPPYSPDLNPIEMVFSKLKALLRKQVAREFDALVDAIALALPSFTPAECRNLIRHANYATN